MTALKGVSIAVELAAMCVVYEYGPPYWWVGLGIYRAVSGILVMVMTTMALKELDGLEAACEA